MASGILTAFLGALQASLSVLLTIFYGFLASHFRLVTEVSAPELSRLCVRLLLPFLLIYNIGSHVSADTVLQYIPILVWAALYNTISIAGGVFLTRVFKLPEWVTPAMTFNNTTSLPLLLVESLKATGILESILMSPDDTTTKAVTRAESYFLVNALVNNSLTFALGPRLLNANEEDPPLQQPHKRNNEPSQHPERDVEDGRTRQSGDVENDGAANDEQPTEETSLLPGPVRSHAALIYDTAHDYRGKAQERLPAWANEFFGGVYQFMNAPLIGAVIGAILGLIPPLHRIFFNGMTEGGYFRVWLTASIKNVGELFTALQVLVVGIKLYHGMAKASKGEASGKVPWRTFLLVSSIRFVVWPLISIPLIWILAAKTKLLGDDPILWFSMMLMHTGPTALTLTALAEVSSNNEEMKMAVSKYVTLSYAVSPLLSLAVVGSLKASEAALG